MRVENIPSDVDFILEGKNEKIFFTNRITTKTKIACVSDLFAKKLQTVLIKGFEPKNEDEELLLQRIKGVSKNLVLEINCNTDYAYIQVYERIKDGHLGGCGGTSLSYDRIYELIDKNELFSFKFINTVKLSLNTISFQLYEAIYKDGIYTINHLETKSILMKKGVGIELKDDLDVLIDFLKLDEIGLFQRYGLKEIKNMIFNNFSYENGFFDVYDKINGILDECVSYRDDIKKYVSMLYYYSFIDYYYFMEAMIKSKQIDKIVDLNPYFTGKDIPKIAEIKTVSNGNMKLLEKFDCRIESSLVEMAASVESNPKIGIDGLNIILNTFLLLNQKKKLDLSIFGWFRLDTVLQLVNVIINQFEITPKNLMDRMIREMFYNNINGRDFLQYVFDYIQMCKALNINIDKKLPKDVIYRHDILIVQLRTLQQKHLEKAFDIANKKNIDLLKFKPNNPNYIIYCPKSLSDLIEKGFEARHCVGSYGSLIIDGSSKIFFVEDKNSNGCYFTTFELNEKNQLIQAKGFANRIPNKDILAYIKEFIENINE